MKIAIDVSPLQTGHKVRGTGFYLENLKAALLKYHPENNYLFFIEEKQIPKDFELVHYPYFEPFFINLPLSKKRKTVITIHDLTPLVFPDSFPAGFKGNIKWQIQKNLLKNVDAVITDSTSSQKDISKFTGISQDKIHVTYLAAGEMFGKIKKNHQLKEVQLKYDLPKKFVLYVGDVTANKNLPRLIKAVNKLDIPLVMAGSALKNEHFDKNHPWNKDLVEVLKLIEQNNKIIRLGFISTEDLVAIYNLATVFVMPSLYEGFGLPILEAMQSGTPVVTSKSGSLQEVSAEAAKFVDPKDSDDIAKGIKEVFENPDLQKKLSEKGFEQSKKFTWKKTAEKTVQTYKNILGE